MAFKIVPLSQMQNKDQLTKLAEFSGEHWPFGAWDRESFEDNDSFDAPSKLELSHVLLEESDSQSAVDVISSKIVGLVIASIERDKYLDSALDDYVYFHKVLIDPDYRGKRLGDGRSLFGCLYESCVAVAENDFSLDQQVLTVDFFNEDAISIYLHYGFKVLGECDGGKYLMGKGFDY